MSANSHVESKSLSPRLYYNQNQQSFDSRPSIDNNNYFFKGLMKKPQNNKKSSFLFTQKIV